LEQRVDDSFPQTTHSPKGEGGAVEVEVDMSRVDVDTRVEIERVERESRESEEKEREVGEERKTVGIFTTAESPVDSGDDDDG